MPPSTLPTPAPGRRRIAFGSDHVGLDLKTVVLVECRSAGFEVLDLGTHDRDRIDYPDTAYHVTQQMLAGHADLGILVCGTGTGMQIAANRHPAIRAAAVHDTYTARHARAHNDANVICLGARTLTVTMALEVLAQFLATEFDGGRHQQRIEKLSRHRW